MSSHSYPSFSNGGLCQVNSEVQSQVTRAVSPLVTDTATLPPHHRPQEFMINSQTLKHKTTSCAGPGLRGGKRNKLSSTRSDSVFNNLDIFHIDFKVFLNVKLCIIHLIILITEGFFFFGAPLNFAPEVCASFASP